MKSTGTYNVKWIHKIFFKWGNFLFFHTVRQLLVIVESDYCLRYRSRRHEISRKKYVQEVHMFSVFCLISLKVDFKTFNNTDSKSFAFLHFFPDLWPDGNWKWNANIAFGNSSSELDTIHFFCSSTGLFTKKDISKKAVTQELCISDHMSSKPKCVWEVVLCWAVDISGTVCLSPSVLFYVINWITL